MSMKQNRHPTRSSAVAAPTPELLAYALLDAAHALRVRLEEALQTVELSGAKYELLSQLVERGGPLPLSELAVGQQCAPSNITQLIDRLEAEGLVRRVDDPSDRRGKRAELTPLGEKRQLAGAREVQRIQAEFADALTAADRAALARGLAAWTAQ
jgi:DNA-binding MarR family transcriptional regulator